MGLNLPAEIQTAFDYYRYEHGVFWKNKLLIDAVDLERYIGKFEFSCEIKAFANNGGLEQLLQALVNCEDAVIESEINVKDYFDKQSEASINGTGDSSEMAIKNVLQLLGRKIEGVN